MKYEVIKMENCKPITIAEFKHENDAKNFTLLKNREDNQNKYYYFIKD